jgi:hypothetical protein
MEKAMMSARQMRDWACTAQFDLWRLLGWPGFAGVALLLAVVMAVCAVFALNADTRHVRAAIAMVRTAKAMHPDRRKPADDPARVLATLPSLFPPFAQNGKDVATILEQAHAANLTLGSAQYQVGADRSGPFTTYQVLLPVKDRYVAIRRFVALVLDSVPNAALQEIHVERAAVSGDVLEARIRFNLIYRASRS